MIQDIELMQSLKQGRPLSFLHPPVCLKNIVSIFFFLFCEYILILAQIFDIARDLLLANIVELCSMNNVFCPISCLDLSPGAIMCSRKTPLDPEYRDMLLNKVASLTSTTSFEEIKATLEEINSNIPIANFEHFNKKAVTTLFKFLESNEGDLPKDQLVLINLLVLGSLHRLLGSKVAFEDIPLMKSSVNCIFELLKHDDADIKLAAVFVVRSMIVQYGEKKNSQNGKPYLFPIY
jgi:hypothetical protein